MISYFGRSTFSTTISNSISSLSASFHLFCSNKNFVWASLTRCCDDLHFISIKSFFVNTKRHYFNLVGILLSDKTFKWIQSAHATTVHRCTYKSAISFRSIYSFLEIHVCIVSLPLHSFQSSCLSDYNLSGKTTI